MIESSTKKRDCCWTKAPTGCHMRRRAEVPSRAMRVFSLHLVLPPGRLTNRFFGNYFSEQYVHKWLGLGGARFDRGGGQAVLTGPQPRSYGRARSPKLR